MLLTGTEARQIADRLADGDSLTAALGAVPQGSRAEVRALLGYVGSATDVVLWAIEGARSTTTSVEPVWTMPGHLAGSGPLTTSVAHLVAGARRSVTCSTFNFQRTSVLWTALADAARRPEMDVRVYVDTAAAAATAPAPDEVAAHLYPATVLRTTAFSGKQVRNHAKFLAIDHRFLLVTSANFS
jgi:phosphatidylserine/phosphatidylglycerophosphate/cardiolipin synthase-like enzyme